MTTQAQLTLWRAQRNITEPLGSEAFERALEEEIDEYTLACTNNDTHEKVDAINDLLIFCRNELALMSYDEELCQVETLKEISSRQQDPLQVTEWQLHGMSGKWRKDPNQDQSTLYKSNYTTCKLEP